MQTIYFGTLSVNYREKQYRDFDEFMHFKRSIDNIFKENGIPLKKVPDDPTPRFNSIFYDFYVDYQSDSYYKIIEKIKELSLYDQLAYRLDFKFTKKEKDESPLFFMATYFDFHATNMKHPSEYGTTYEKCFVCPNCGVTKFKQTSPLYWDVNQMKKRLLVEIPSSRHTGGYSLIVSERLSHILLQNNFSGYSLETVHHVGKRQPMQQCYQMLINNILPPLSDKMPIIDHESYCSECAKYLKLKFPLHYDKPSLDNICDFNISYEDTVYPDFQPRVLIAPRVKELFEILKIKGVYQPIIVV